MSDTTTTRKNITLVRNDMTKVISIASTHSGQALRNTIKTVFGLPLDSEPALENINTNVILGDIQAADLLADSDENSVYRVFISEDQQSEGRWLHRLWQQFLLPFLRKYC